MAEVRMMVPHHQGAVEMAKIAQQRAERPEIKQMAEAIIRSQDAEIKDLAKQIIADQQREIEQLQQWRRSWFS